MTRRDFLKTGLAATVAGSVPACLSDAHKPALQPLSGVDAFNYVIGTQTIGATYQFTREPLQVETARAILDLGSNILKTTLGRDYGRMMLGPARTAYPETMQYLLNQGSDAAQTPRIRFPGAALEPPPRNPAIRTLTDLARLEPSYRQVIALPFAYYLIWTYAFTPRWWQLGFPVEDQEKEYREIYDLVAYLLKTHSGTGKTFFLGHWEGDWHLRPDLNTQTDAGVTPQMLQGMTNWLNTRQKAVDDAKRRIHHHQVQVFCYTEVNHVSSVSLAGRPSVANSVLPQTNIDYVSYSAYDSLDDLERKVPQALDYIESKLPAKLGLAGKRVFIGEYGFAARTFGETERNRKSRQMMRVGLEWGCPFVLSWAMYNNEFSNGAETGYWLIDDQGVKQPLWHAHHDFLDHSRRRVAEFQQTRQRLPTADEFRRFAAAWFA